MFVPEDAPRDLIAELTLWRAVRLLATPPALSATPRGSLRQRLAALRAATARFGAAILLSPAAHAPPAPGTCADTLGRAAALLAREGFFLPAANGLSGPPPRPPRTNRTRRVLHPVLIGHAVSLNLY